MKIKSFRVLAMRSIQLCVMFAIYCLFSASILTANGAFSLQENSEMTEMRLEDEHGEQKQRVYSFVDHTIRICVFAFLSAVFAGLTLGVMCANTFTLEIIAESGPSPDCRYAATVLPLRKKGHKTLCTLIISNMLCNVLIVQEFSTVFDVVEVIRTQGTHTHAIDGSASGVWKFVVSTLVILLFAEVLPMSICRSKYSLRVAAAGSIFVNVAMILTYPLSASLGWFLDLVVGSEETGQLYDKKKLRKLMVLHYERSDANDTQMPKSELNLLLAALDFHERKVRDIMTPINKTTYVRDTDLITPDFVEMLWKSGRSRVPVESAPGVFESILVVKDLMTVNTSAEFSPLTVAQVVKAKDRVFAMVCATTSLPSMLKFFLEAQTHMAVVFEEDAKDYGSMHPALLKDTDAPQQTDSSAQRSFTPTITKIIGIVTMEDVVEGLLASEIYDEYDRYEPVEQEPRYAAVDVPGGSSKSGTLQVPKEPQKPPRVNFYSYFTHPTESIPLTDSQVWAVAYYLNRTVPSFYGWKPPYIKLLLDECKDLQICAETPSSLHNSTADLSMSTLDVHASDGCSSPSSLADNVHHMSSRSPFVKNGHIQFLNAAKEKSHILYSRGIRSDRFLLVLGGCVEILVGPEAFRSKLQSFNYIGEEALTASFFVPDFSVVVMTAARVYSISRALFEKYLHYQSSTRHHASKVRILSPGIPSSLRTSTSHRYPVTVTGSEKDSLLCHCGDTIQVPPKQYGTASKHML
ncbi:hypothetical protein JKF63_06497 [Porcisia hertigi]|uniref:CNNM transmembrane domain-containing protein n=1 Tax=Porcisia hertigi TaxID=2761500 RepID=A0A836LIJ2_9TRYP|nr:hypothetical protein JKF63_06497 [Porcisia hertigi]